ncbi:ATP-binding protein [Streptomyces sp. NPDC047014]|uniref:ATP-binding protein n=1 Tax=Streptomyces sp. NPDC047014 TaxID=3155736 RepID=UPI0033E76501
MDRTHGQNVPTGPDERSADGPAAPAATPPAGQQPARVVTLTAGDHTLTVNPVDGSEIEPLRPDAERPRPAKRTPAGRRAREAAARPPVAPGGAIPARPLLERAEELERLVRLLGRGRSVRLTGPAGSGRSTLLDAVALRCGALAPDGLVRLSGHGHQQPGELLHALYAAVYEAPQERPGQDELLARVREIGAVVLLDDLEMGGPALDELLHATPECAYLLAATPATRAPSDDSHIEEVFLGGLSRAGCLELLETGLGRPLTDEETAWAGDLAFASEGLPLRFVQAAALLRQRDELNRTDEEDDGEEPGVFEERPRDGVHVPLPTLAEGAAPAELLASRVSESARAALRTACALGGELPHHAHLPALVGDTHADTAVAELLACGLLTPVGTRYRLASGVARQLEDAAYGDTAAEEARTAARHYVWWTGHASVLPERVAAEADAVLAALAGADVVAAVLLARTAAPAFAASLHWEAWERVLRSGAEAARKAGEVAEQAYFHHELGVLALCEGRVDRARTELETSIGLRGALADKRGTVAGRRALALVVDREKAGVSASPPLRLAAPATGPEAATTALPTAETTAEAAAPTAPLPKATAPTAPLPKAAEPTPFPKVTPPAAATNPLPKAADPTAPLPKTPAPTPFPQVNPPAAATEPLPKAAAPTPFPKVTPPATATEPLPKAAAPTPFPQLAPPAGATTPQPAGAEPTTPFPKVTSSAGPTAPLPKAGAPLPPAGGGVEAGPAGAAASRLRKDSAVSEAAVNRVAPVTPVSSEAVTRMTPVVPVTERPEPPSALSDVFADAFPLSPQPAPPTTRVPLVAPAPPARAPGRRRRALLAVAGALAVVTLGTVVSLAMSSSDPEDTAPPADGPAVSSTPAASAAPTTVQQNSGNDPAPEPPVTAPSEAGTTPEASAAAPSPGRTPGRTPSRRPSTGPSNSPRPGTPSPAPTTADPSPTPTDTGEASPTATAPTGPGTATATGATTAP